MTHNYVDIMSRIYVDSTPTPQGSKNVGGAQRRVRGNRQSRASASGGIVSHARGPRRGRQADEESHGYARRSWRVAPAWAPVAPGRSRHLQR